MICLWESLLERNSFERASSTQSHSWGSRESKAQLLSERRHREELPTQTCLTSSPDTSTNHQRNMLNQWTMTRNDTRARTERKKQYFEGTCPSLGLAGSRHPSSSLPSEQRGRAGSSAVWDLSYKGRDFCLLRMWKAIAVVSRTDSRKP